MKSTSLVLVAAYLALAGYASASFSGFFAVPSSQNWSADAAGSTVAIGNWVLDGSGNASAILQSSGLDPDANSVTLSALSGGWGEFSIANTSGTPYSVSFTWSTQLDHAGDSVSYVLNGGAPTVLASGNVGLQGNTVSSLLLPAFTGTFLWRVASQAGANTTSAAFFLSTPVAVPEPSAATLAVLGLAASSLLRRRRA